MNTIGEYVGKKRQVTAEIATIKAQIEQLNASKSVPPPPQSSSHAFPQSPPRMSPQMSPQSSPQSQLQLPHQSQLQTPPKLLKTSNNLTTLKKRPYFKLNFSKKKKVSRSGEAQKPKSITHMSQENPTDYTLDQYMAMSLRQGKRRQPFDALGPYRTVDVRPNKRHRGDTLPGDVDSYLTKFR